ncbi:MAG: hypothetical protein WBO55_05550 [Rhizobiaceae bacterium]
MSNLLKATGLAALLLAGASVSAQAGGYSSWGLHYDGTQPYHSRAVAGAAPNSHATFYHGVRCHYEYRVQYGAYGAQRIQVQVCN